MNNGISTWTATLPNGAKMSGCTDACKPDQVNTYNAAGNYSGSLPMAVWLDGLEKIKAAGGSVEVA